MNEQIEKAQKEFNALAPHEKSQVLFHQGVQLHQQNRFEEALKLYSQAVALTPDFADAYNNMAVALRKLQCFQAALTCYKRSLSIRPDHPGTYSNMGNVLNDLDLMQASLGAHQKAMELDPENLLYQYNTALVLRDAGKLDEAIRLFDAVLEKEADYKDCRWDRALTHLMAGRFKEGFADYDARWKLAKSPPRTFNEPRWQGEDLTGRTLFIHREQGFGDAIQFLRLVAEVKKRFGGKIILECQPELVTLFENTAGVDQLVPFGQKPPAFDCWIPLMSLSHILDIEEQTIPRTIPYLSPPEKSRFRVRPAPEGGLNIGIVWAGSPTHQNDRRRSVPVERFLPLADHKGVTLFSLQKGDYEKELITSGAKHLLIDAGKDIRDFADTASLASQLDLIICIDTSVAHLAGALGVPVWLILPFTPDWRWMIGREDSPWYPQMRLFRQSSPGDWESCFEKVYRALDEKLIG